MKADTLGSILSYFAHNRILASARKQRTIKNPKIGPLCPPRGTLKTCWFGNMNTKLH